MVSRFIVLGSGRTGSNLLVSMLNSHPQIQCLNELFNPSEPDRILWGRAERETGSEDLALRASNPVRFLEERVFVDPTGRARLVGFKIFYYHARDPIGEQVWLHLRSDSELKVIHIKRRNRLRKHLSEQVAKMTRKWAITSDREAHRNIKVTLPVEQCVASFERTIGYENEAAEFFKNHAILDVYYEALSSNSEQIGARVLNFLGAKQLPMVSSTRRQIVQPLREIVENYDDLVAHFAGTPWERYLNDDESAPEE